MLPARTPWLLFSLRVHRGLCLGPHYRLCLRVPFHFCSETRLLHLTPVYRRAWAENHIHLQRLCAHRERVRVECLDVRERGRFPVITVLPSPLFFNWINLFCCQGSVPIRMHMTRLSKETLVIHHWPSLRTKQINIINGGESGF